jgi:integrase
MRAGELRGSQTRRSSTSGRLSRTTFSPHFAAFPLSAITVRAVDEYKAAKLRERSQIEAARAEAFKRGERFNARPLSNSSINHTVRILAQVLEQAVEYELIDSNPAVGKRRHLKTSTPARPFVMPEALPAFLGAAPDGAGRALLSILAGGGLRIEEALSLRHRDVDLGAGSLFVRTSKTDAGVREVHLSHGLREALTLWRADTAHAGPDDYVVCTRTGRKHNPSNLRRDVLAPTVKRANEKLELLGIAPITEGLTFHSLRRTVASIRCATEDVAYVAAQLGHRDPRFTLRCYTAAVNRRDRLSKPHQKQYDAAIEWAATGSKEPLTVPALQTQATAATKNPA